MRLALQHGGAWLHPLPDGRGSPGKCGAPLSGRTPSASEGWALQARDHFQAEAGISNLNSPRSPTRLPERASSSLVAAETGFSKHRTSTFGGSPGLIGPEPTRSVLSPVACPGRIGGPLWFLYLLPCSSSILASPETQRW